MRLSQSIEFGTNQEVGKGLAAFELQYIRLRTYIADNFHFAFV